ncbi:MAG: single-stranded DNA-binding protein [Clostridiales bacterium]|nr:single-stranded DNA-binding protein [Clostridiales bacterium]
MGDNSLNTNNVIMAGEICSEMELSHKSYGEGFYSFFLKVKRLSGYSDIIPIMVSERLIFNMDIHKGLYVLINGQLRTYNKIEEDRNKLVITIFAREIRVLLDEVVRNPNRIYLEGFICKPPIYRLTPLGREICDIMLAVNRAYNKSDYIPCIAWGRNAKFSQSLEVGAHIKIWGRIQSREYKKKINDEKVEVKTAFEVSILKMEG